MNVTQCDIRFTTIECPKDFATKTPPHNEGEFIHSKPFGHLSSLLFLLSTLFLFVGSQAINHIHY